MFNAGHKTKLQYKTHKAEFFPFFSRTKMFTVKRVG